MTTFRVHDPFVYDADPVGIRCGGGVLMRALPVQLDGVSKQDVLKLTVADDTLRYSGHLRFIWCDSKCLKQTEPL